MTIRASRSMAPMGIRSDVAEKARKWSVIASLSRTGDITVQVYRGRYVRARINTQRAAEALGKERGSYVHLGTLNEVLDAVPSGILVNSFSNHVLGMIEKVSESLVVLYALLDTLKWVIDEEVVPIEVVAARTIRVVGDAVGRDAASRIMMSRVKPESDLVGAFKELLIGELCRLANQLRRIAELFLSLKQITSTGSVYEEGNAEIDAPPAQSPLESSGQPLSQLAKATEIACNLLTRAMEMFLVRVEIAELQYAINRLKAELSNLKIRELKQLVNAKHGASKPGDSPS